MRVMATTHATASLRFAHDGWQWETPVRRDRHAHGLFYDAVQTSGV